MSRLLVVDTDVIRAAGKTDHPVSRASREILSAILKICHQVTYTESLREEWNEHQSRFSSRWRTAMAARQKPIKIGKEVPVALPRDDLSEKNRRVIEKDRHILQAALAADKIIVTLEKELRDALSSTQKTRKVMDSIKWVHPVTDGVECLENL